MATTRRKTTNPSNERVWRALSAALRAFIGRRVQDPADRERVLREVLRDAERGLGQIRDGERVSSFLYQLARGRIAELQQEKSAGALLFEAFAPPPPDDDDQVREELASWMEPCVEALPDAFREALLCAELEELSQPEVADRLGLSLGSAKRRMNQGRQRLQEMLEGCCKRELTAA